VNIREIRAKSVLLKRKKVDSWFVSRYGMNLYRGCAHNCVYCDGRSERYQVDGVFGETVVVKTNAVDVLRRELKPIGRRVKLKPGFVLVGGGVGDSYQPVEKQYQLTRKTLKLLCEYRWPVHVLTKSTLVERDFDVLKQINQQNRAIISFSFSSTNDEASAVFEPNVPPPSERLKTMAFFKRNGFACGMFLLPVIPFITDTPEMITETLRKAHKIGVDFVIFGGMTLKEGRQKEHFFNSLRAHYPELAAKYKQIYGGENKWGQPTEDYYAKVCSVFTEVSRKYKIDRRMPPALYSDILSENDLVTVMLEQLDYFLQLEGKRSSFGYAAYAISQLNAPLSTMKNRLKEIKGVGEKTEKIILEILETKDSSYYNNIKI
jgi:DNA repair photolyase